MGGLDKRYDVMVPDPTLWGAQSSTVHTSDKFFKKI